MQMQNQDFKSVVSNISLLGNLEKLCEIKNLDVSEYLSVYNNHICKLDNSHEFDLSLISKISSDFDINTNDFLTGNIDFEWVKKPTLPSKYLLSSGSKIRNSLVPLMYIKKFYGEKFYNFVRKSLKIPFDVLAQPDMSVSVELLLDLFQFLAKSGITDDQFSQIGTFITQIDQNRLVAKELEDLNSPMQVYSKLFEETILIYEQNFDYKIQKANFNSISVEIKQKERLTEDIKKNLTGNKYLSSYRSAACAAQLSFTHLGEAIAQKIYTRDNNVEKFTLSW